MTTHVSIDDQVRHASVGTVASEGKHRVFGFPLLVDVDAVVLERVSGDDEVAAAGCAICKSVDPLKTSRRISPTSKCIGMGHGRSSVINAKE